MHFALGDIFPLNGEGQLGFIISLIVSLTNTNTNTNTNSIKLYYININIKYQGSYLSTFGSIVASRSPVSKYLKTVVTFSISLVVSCSSPSTGTGVGSVGSEGRVAAALVEFLASDFIVRPRGYKV